MTNENTVEITNNDNVAPVIPQVEQPEVTVDIGNGFPSGVERRINIKKLKPNPKNDRFNPGQSYGGFVMPDTLDLNQLEVWFLSETPTKKAGELSDPLYVEEIYKYGEFSPTGKPVVDYYMVLRGNRRWYLMNRLDNDPTCPSGVKEQMKEIKCIVFKNLSHGQRQDLIHDKAQKDLTKVEKVALLWRDQDNGMSPTEIYLKRYAEMNGLLKDANGYITKINACDTFAKRKEEIVAWMKGTIGAKYLPAGNLGERVKKACMLGLLKDDGLLKDTDPKPEFEISQGRMQELLKIKKEDQTAGIWTYEHGSERFNAKIEEYYVKDLPKLDPVTAAKLGINAVKTEVMKDANGDPLAKRSQKDCLELELKMKSLTVRTALQWAKGEAPVILVDLDAQALFWEQVGVSLVNNVATLTGDLKVFAEMVRQKMDPATVIKFLERKPTQVTVTGTTFNGEPDTDMSNADTTEAEYVERIADKAEQVQEPVTA